MESCNPKVIFSARSYQTQGWNDFFSLSYLLPMVFLSSSVWYFPELHPNPWLNFWLLINASYYLLLLLSKGRAAFICLEGLPLYLLCVLLLQWNWICLSLIQMHCVRKHLLAADFMHITETLCTVKWTTSSFQTIIFHVASFDLSSLQHLVWSIHFFLPNMFAVTSSMAVYVLPVNGDYHIALVTIIWW